MPNERTPRVNPRVWRAVRCGVLAAIVAGVTLPAAMGCWGFVGGAMIEVVHASPAEPGFDAALFNFILTAVVAGPVLAATGAIVGFLVAWRRPN